MATAVTFCVKKTKKQEGLVYPWQVLGWTSGLHISLEPYSILDVVSDIDTIIEDSVSPSVYGLATQGHTVACHGSKSSNLY